MEDVTIEIERVFEKITMRLYANGIMNVIFKNDTYIDIQDIEAVMSWMEEIGKGRMFVNLMEGAYNSDISPEVREFAASSSQNKYTIADAMVISSQAHKIVTNFYLKFNKPIKPTKIFTDRNKAIEWLLDQKIKYHEAIKAS